MSSVSPWRNGPNTFQSDVLPARCAYIIRIGGKSGFRRAIQEASSRWGGSTELIIPMRKNGTIDSGYHEFLGIAQIDVLINVDADLENVQKLGEKLGLAVVPLRDIDKFPSPSSFTCNPVCLKPEGQRPYILPKVGASLWQITAAGDVTPEVETWMRDSNIPFVRTDFPDQIARSVIGKATLLDSTTCSFAENWARGGTGEHSALIWITEPDSLKDCLWFWNLRAIAPLRFSTAPMFILPSNEVHYWLNFSPYINSSFARSDEFSPDVILNSFSVKETTKLESFAAKLDLVLSNEQPRAGHRWPASPRQAPYSYLINKEYRFHLLSERRYGNTIKFDSYVSNGNVNLVFDSPVKFSGSGFTKLRVSTETFDAYPKKRVVAEIIRQNANWDKFGLVVNTNAQNEYALPIYIPTLAEVTDALLRSSTAAFDVSDKGKIGNALLELGSTTALLVPGVFETITRLTTPRAKQLMKELRRAREEKSSDSELLHIASQWGGRGDRRYVSIDDLPKGVSRPPVEELCAADWAERGFQIRCDHCGRANFVPLPSSLGRPICPGCGSFENYTYSKRGLQIYYRLNTFIDQASDQGILPHILVIEFLKSNSTNTHVIPGVEVALKSGKKAEVDLFGIYQGKVLSGEVKTSSSDFTESQIRKDISISKSLGADLHIMASIFPLRLDQLKFAEKLSKIEKLDLLVVTPEDLQVNA